MEPLIGWLAGLPPISVYLIIALLAATENFFPPFPADTVIAFGAFLAHRGVTDPLTVLSVTLVANMAAAMGMYFLAARHAEALFQSRLAKRLLPPNGIEVVRREYQRFGLPGLFIGRLLPGFRAVVAPFAGLIHIGPLRAGVPMFLASALWYGAIVYGAAMLGERFDEILIVLGGVNRSFGYLALVILVLAVGVVIHRHKRGSTTE